MGKVARMSVEYMTMLEGGMEGNTDLVDSGHRRTSPETQKRPHRAGLGPGRKGAVQVIPPGVWGQWSWFWGGRRKKLENGTNCFHQGANQCQAMLAATANRKSEAFCLLISLWCPHWQ